jgi:hypothetical protein
VGRQLQQLLLRQHVVFPLRKVLLLRVWPLLLLLLERVRRGSVLPRGAVLLRRLVLHLRGWHVQPKRCNLLLLLLGRQVQRQRRFIVSLLQRGNDERRRRQLLLHGVGVVQRHANANCYSLENARIFDGRQLHDLVRVIHDVCIFADAGCGCHPRFCVSGGGGVREQQ